MWRSHRIHSFGFMSDVVMTLLFSCYQSFHMAEVVSLNAIMLFLKIIVSLLVSVSSSYDSIKTRGTLGFLSNNLPPQFS